MKKLLLLGGSRYLRPVLSAAKKLGIYTITCDYLPENFAHKYSDEFANINIVDKDAVLAFAQSKKIDGVMSFACDPGVITAAYVAEKLCLPSIAPFGSVELLQNKGAFRKFLKENSFVVPFSKSYSQKDLAMAELASFHWPVIVKPCDSAGSKGVSKVLGSSELSTAIDKALSYSRSHEFIIEDFIQQEGYSSDCDCLCVNGKLEFVSFSAQHFDIASASPYTPSAYSWPSTFNENQINILKSELARLVDLLHIKNTLLNVETRADKAGNLYLMEVSPRGGGNRLAEMVAHVYNVDIISRAVALSVGLPYEKIQYNNSKNFWAEVILHSKTKGKFKSLSITPSLHPSLIEIDLWVKPGDVVSAFENASHAIGTLIFKFDTKDKLDDFFHNLDAYINVNIE